MTKVVLISTYDMGRQSFSLASAVSWLRAHTGARVDCLDLDIEPLRQPLLAAADLVAFYLPMHTATRLTLPLLAQVKAVNPSARLCCFGLYAPLNAEILRDLGVAIVLGAEFEQELVEAVNGMAPPGPAAGCGAAALTAGGRKRFKVPDRRGLPPLQDYARLVDAPGASKVVGYTETTRGCKHMCRHCPVVPVYQGTFHVVQREVVAGDIHRQVEMGAEHITFGDPDFFNGPTHGLAVVEALNRDHPGLTYDVTIKVEHLLKHRARLPRLKETGCLFITTAVEALDDDILSMLDKGHTRRDFVEALSLCRQAGLTVCPTFVPFTPWTTRASYLRLLDGVAELGLVDHVPPVQLAIRLLITASSRLLELEAVQKVIAPFDRDKLVYPWHFTDPEMEDIADEIMRVVHAGVTGGVPRREIFQQIRDVAAGPPHAEIAALTGIGDSPPLFVPHLTENWFC